jgi:hypothetical protein
MVGLLEGPLGFWIFGGGEGKSFMLRSFLVISKRVAIFAFASFPHFREFMKALVTSRSDRGSTHLAPNSIA